MENSFLKQLFKKQYIFFLIITNLSIIIITAIYIYITYTPFDNIIHRITLEKKDLKVALISDLQLAPQYYTKHYYYDQIESHLIRTLRILKEENIDVLIIAGDISDQGSTYSYNLFKKHFNNIFKNKKPILNIILGNHDYWSVIQESSLTSQMKFHYSFHQSPFCHKVINGYHFIMWSHENRLLDDSANSNIEWIVNEIKKALNEDKNKPIFVITHMNPYDTVYGSLEWGNNNIKNVFINFPNVISISGHSHFSLIDERSIWQGKFTAIQTQAIAYIELEKGKENGSVPKNEFGENIPSFKNYMGLIMNINDNVNLEFNRISFEHNKFYGKKWIIDLPININKFNYSFEKRKEKSVKPYWRNNNINISVKYMKNQLTQKIITILNFEQALHENFVHSYEIHFQLIGKSKIWQFLYFSDFYLIPEERSKFIKFGVPDYLPNGEYKIIIYAIESFGKKSEPIESSIYIKNN